MRPAQDEAGGLGAYSAPGPYREIDVQGTAQTCFYLADGTPMGQVAWSAATSGRKQTTGHR